MNKLVRKPFLLLIKVYQYFLSPFFGTQCRFHPSCSHYAYQAIEQFGILKGCYLAIKRLLRCHPWAQGGLDPVPSCMHDHSNSHHSLSKSKKMAK